MNRTFMIAALLAGALIAQASSAGAAGRPCEVAHLVGGEAGYCALRVDGRVACWGDEAYWVPYAPSPEGRFVQIAVGYNGACGVREDGHGVCWAKESYYEPELEGEFLQLQPGWGGVSALLPDGSLGFLEYGSTSVVVSHEGPFDELSAGCAIRPDRTIYCGDIVEEPAGTFESAAGLCGIADGGQLECWHTWEDLLDPPANLLFRHVSAATLPGKGTCAVTQDGAAMCAGTDLITQSEPDEQFREVAYGYGWPWGLTTDGRLVPWVPYEPDPIVGGSRAIVGDFAQVAAGGDGLRPYTCGVEHSGRVQCWGNTQYQAKSVPDDEFEQVGVGPYHACGLRTDKTIKCWGYDDGLKDTVAPPGSFSQISIGYWGPNCARRTNGSVACWGYGEEALEVPAGAFASVAAGGQRACGLDGSGNATCWRYVAGETVYDIVMEPIETPDGPFDQVAAYFDVDNQHQDSHMCGLRPNGQVVCWSDEQTVESFDPPGGTFVKLSEGGGYACGIRANGQIVCWGPDWLDELRQPLGEFVAATSGAAHTCGLTDDGTVVCAGNDETVSVCAASTSCGNGDVDDSESCDDGDTSFQPGDACTGGCWSVPCGQPIHPEADGPVASDALFALRAAVGSSTCSAEVCDVDSSSQVTASDALAILKKSVDPERALHCA